VALGNAQAWERRSEYQVVESNIKYIQDIARISAPGYIPTDADILLSRVRTTGIVEESYIIDKINFIIIDVGGQRNERKKWMHLFDTVNAVIFVAALSEYDQVGAACLPRQSLVRVWSVPQ
jgi:guanine nucleotide-binding protein G(i) subunit alpha